MSQVEGGICKEVEVIDCITSLIHWIIIWSKNYEVHHIMSSWGTMKVRQVVLANIKSYKGEEGSTNIKVLYTYMYN